MIKQLFKKMVPSQILSSFSMSLCVQLDILLIGFFLGADGMASYGIANPVLTFFTAATGLFSMGIATVCSQLTGKGDEDGIHRNFSSVVVTTLVASAIFTFVMAVAQEPLLIGLGAEPGTRLFTMTQDYLNGYTIGIPAYFLMTSLTSYLHIAGKRRTVILSVAVMTVLDVALDIVSGAVIKDGMFGIGLATSLSEIGGCLVVLVYFLRKSSMFRFHFRSISPKQILRTLTEGLPIAVNQFCFMICILAINRLLLTYGGSDALAVYSVLNSVTTLCFAASQGVGTTVQMLTGIFFGEEDRNNLLETLKQGILWALSLNVIITGLLILFARPLCWIFITDNPALLDLAAHALRLFAFNVVPMSLCIIFKDYYPCINKLHLSLLLGVFENVLVMIPVHYFMAKMFALDGLWVAKIFAETLALLFVVVVSFLKNRQWGLGIQKVSLIAHDFSVPEDCVACFDIRTVEDASSVSESARLFCRSSGCKPVQANYIALSIEEMAVDILERNANEGISHLIQVRIVKKQEGWIVRMRDNCIHFDIVRYMDLHKEDDSLSHLGVRMVSKFITEANYINSLGFNCLTMKLVISDK